MRQGPWRAICLFSGLTVLPATLLAQVENPDAPPNGGPTAPTTTYDDALSATTVNGAIAGEAIFTTCATGLNGEGSVRNQKFQDDCNLIVGGASTDAAGSAVALEQLAADQISAQNSAVERSAGAGITVTQGRLERIRLADRAATGTGAVLAGNNLLSMASGGGASADLTAGPFGGFFNYEYISGDEDQTAFQPGYDATSWSLAAGMDYRFNDSFVGGLAVRYADEDTNFDNSRGDMTGESWGIIGYGSYFLPNGLFIDGSLGYSNTDFVLEREINYSITGSTARQIAKSDSSADIWNLSVAAGYDLFVNPFSITPSLRLSYVENSVDGYRETMSDPTGVGGGMALSIDAQTYTSLTTNLGVQISRAISTDSGVWVPQLRVGWIHEFENGQQQVGATFVNDINQQPLYILTSEPDENYFDVGIGVSGQFANGRSAFIAYNTLLGYDNLTYNAITAGVRLEF
ncbi:autotransporter outer membrane beta-barrel domain-containing protein [Thiorhodococcus mannitoliphagus]|uniref:Autotransporter outer membrane beta-barrel domain-containing protein n=1 Tax=Thiorhodococcus mannitoliphagus TaxID=329406 RepID=A0A6P1E3Z8_9GAMM|nr:autotransporter outer membrane beta-barrel domain-containing protein [Thiorhodococcus mannitoliphagus]NEX22405.1 autotransporter outer membrane beta-barrel domain-containing protein [Thiorhodococcus mannitoliphagus]